VVEIIENKKNIKNTKKVLDLFLKMA